MNIIYIHGFRSSGDSSKAAFLREKYPHVNVISPTFSPNPQEVVDHLQSILQGLEGKTLLLGTSLGGFYALYFACTRGYTCCAINPAWQPQVTLKRKIGTHKRYDSEEIYSILPADRTKPYSTHEFLARILDDSSFEEYKQDYGKTIICGYGRIDGWSVGIVINNRAISKSDSLTEDSS